MTEHSNQVVTRWMYRTNQNLELYLCSMQKHFKSYEKNIFILNSKALLIQHWFFIRLPNQRKQKIIKRIKSMNNQTKTLQVNKVEELMRTIRQVRIDNTENITPNSDSILNQSRRKPFIGSVP